MKKKDPNFSVLHVSYSKKVPIGVLRQLRSEVEANFEERSLWEVKLFTSSDIDDDFVIKLPENLPTIIQILLVYRWCFRHRNNYDIILFRNIKAEFVGFVFMPLIGNIVTIHHTKEIEECAIVKPRAYGFFLSILERIFGSLKLNFSKGLAAVTQEIVDYEQKRIFRNKPKFVIPNGIFVKDVKPMFTNGLNGYNVVFVASRFEIWHGLENLLLSFFNSPTIKIKLHLVGDLLPGQSELIAEVNQKHNRTVITTYGRLDKEELLTLYDQCVIGLGSFALEEKGLIEASTLKVREYLNNGLPVFSGHYDSGFTSDFEYYRIGKPDISEIEKFVEEIQGKRKEDIRSESIVYIDKGAILSETYQRLKRIFG